MPRVIRRLWLLDFEASLCDSPTSSLLFVLLRGTINRTMSSTYELVVGCVKKKNKKNENMNKNKQKNYDVRVGVKPGSVKENRRRHHV